MTDTAPQPVGQRLAAQVARLAERQPVLHRATPDALLPDDYDDLPSPGQALAAQRLVTWRRAIPQRFQWADLDNGGVDPEVLGELVGWARNPGSRNLVMLGPVGVGKSWAAVDVHAVEGLRWLCAPAHEWTHANPAAARKLGLLHGPGDAR